MTQSAHTGQRHAHIRTGSAEGFSVKILYKQTQGLLRDAFTRLDARAAARVKILEVSK